MSTRQTLAVLCPICRVVPTQRPFRAIKVQQSREDPLTVLPQAGDRVKRHGVNDVHGTSTSHPSVLHADEQIPTDLAELQGQVLAPTTQVKKQRKTPRLMRTAPTRAPLALTEPIGFRLEGPYGGAAQRSAKERCLAEQPSIAPRGPIGPGVNASKHRSKPQPTRTKIDTMSFCSRAPSGVVQYIFGSRPEPCV